MKIKDVNNYYQNQFDKIIALPLDVSTYECPWTHRITHTYILTNKHKDLINSTWWHLTQERGVDWPWNHFYSYLKETILREPSPYGYGYRRTYYEIRPLSEIERNKTKQKKRWRYQLYNWSTNRCKTSYQRKPHHEKKEPQQPRWVDRKKSWRHEWSGSKCKKFHKKEMNRRHRAYEKQMIHHGKEENLAFTWNPDQFKDGWDLY